MDKFIESLPKPVLVFLVLVVAIVVFMIISPPHSICDTQAAAFKESQSGRVFDRVETVKRVKRTIPATLGKAKEACQLGNSAGSCYEYFSVLREIARGISNASPQCMDPLLSIKEVSEAFADGVEIMVRLAWGVKPPEVGLDRFGWMQEADLAIFCRLKNVYIRAKGEEAWTNMRKRISTKLPGEEIVATESAGLFATEPRKASDILSEQDIWDRSLFSVRCDNFM